MAKAVRSNAEGVELYNGSGKRVASLNPLLSKLDGGTVEIGVSDVGRVFSENYQMNPTTQYLPSNIVTPHQLWLPYVGQINILMNLVWAIKQYLDNVEEDNQSGVNNKPKTTRMERFRVVDFNEILPEGS